MFSKKIFSLLLFFSFIYFAEIFATEFSMTITFKNNSDNWKKLNLEKGRIFEIAKIDASHYQSIIITSGDGIIIIPPQETVERTISGICLHKGLKFPPEGCIVNFTPFVGDSELITTDQKKVHSLTEEPIENVMIVIGKGYSDDKKNGRMADRDEAIWNAMENASIQAGISFESESILKDINLIKDFRKLSVKEKSVQLNKVIHEDYNDKTGEYLFIGEFKVTSKAPKPELVGIR
ncbi:hypothetical protein ACFL4Z_03300 [candidate division KSB1 bacterium]